MADIVPELWKQIEEDFKERVNSDSELRKLMEDMTYSMRPSYALLDEIAERFGQITSEALLKNLSDGVLPDGKMYYNIAERTILPALKLDYDCVIDAVETVQTAINEAVGASLKAQIPAFNQDRANGIINRLTSEERFSDASWILGEPVENFSMSIVDEAAELNAEFQHSAGRKSFIKRRVTGGCCRWCTKLAGTYEYPDVPKDIYRRHSYCRCTVEYVADDGTVKDVHNGRQGEKTHEQERRESLQKTIEEIERNRQTEDLGAALENRINKINKYEEDIFIGRSVGAKLKNYDIELPNKQVVHLTEGSKITQVQVIAGKGRERKIDEIDLLIEKWGGSESTWQKKKGIGYIDYNGESYKAELHWYEEPTAGKHKWKIKPDAAGNWFIDD